MTECDSCKDPPIFIRYPEYIHFLIIPRKGEIENLTWRWINICVKAMILSISDFHWLFYGSIKLRIIELRINIIVDTTSRLLVVQEFYFIRNVSWTLRENKQRQTVCASKRKSMFTDSYTHSSATMDRLYYSSITMGFTIPISHLSR